MICGLELMSDFDENDMDEEKLAISFASIKI